MKPLERLTHRLTVRSGLIVVAATMVLALSSTSARRAGIHTNVPAAITNEVGAVLGGGPAPAGFTEQEGAAVADLGKYVQNGGLTDLTII